MTRLARLRDAFLPGQEPERALFCTYGFDARFFEAEVLPAMLPSSLSLDREAGSPAAYLNAGDVAMQRREVSVFYDHLLGEGPELLYGAWPVDVLPRRFHAKLALLDYGDRIRAVIGSANLTRAAWTGLLELFVAEDLLPGVSHPWSQGLRRFLGHLAERVPAGQPTHQAAVRRLLENVADGAGDERVVSTWDEPLLDALFEGTTDVKRLDVTTPFFEGAEGPGVFDALTERAPKARGRLYASTIDNDGRAQVSGPPEKLETLLQTRRWSLHGVRASWDGDEEGAPLRALHGKLLAATHADGTRVMLGSANVTRAALLGHASTGERAGRANVELVVLRDTTPRDLPRILPQAEPLALGDVDIVEAGDPTGEDDEQPPGPEQYVIEATYRAATRTLTVLVAEDSPPLTATYAGRRLTEHAPGAVAATVDLAAARFVVVDDGTASGIVPFTVIDPERLLARGTAWAIDLETFFEMLAGGRDLPVRSGEVELTRGAAGDDTADSLVGTRGAIPWRRYLAAVAGLGEELERERHLERSVRFTLENPVRLAGLLERLDKAYDRRRFTAADLLYAVYEIEREIARVCALESPAKCSALLAEAHEAISRRRRQLMDETGPDVAAQLRIITRLDAKT